MLTRKRAIGLSLALIAVLAVSAALTLLSPTGASEFLIHEEPQRGETVAEAPHQLLLTFAFPLAQIKGVHRVEVTDGQGQRIDDGHADISTHSQRTLIVPIHAKDDGELQVHYRVRLLVNGESIDETSSYSFAIDHELAPGEGGELVQAASAKSSQSLVLWTIAILIGIAVAGGLVYFLRMATGNSRTSLEPTNRSVFRD